MNVVPLELATEINNAVGCFFKGFYSFLLMKVKLEMNLNMAKKNMNKEKVLVQQEVLNTVEHF